MGVEVGVVVALRDEEKKDEVKEVLRDEEEEEGGLRGEVRARDEDTIVRGVTRPLTLEMRETSRLLAPLSKQLDPKRNENWQTVKLRKTCNKRLLLCTRPSFLTHTLDPGVHWLLAVWWWCFMIHSVL